MGYDQSLLACLGRRAESDKGGGGFHGRKEEAEEIVGGNQDA